MANRKPDPDKKKGNRMPGWVYGPKALPKGTPYNPNEERLVQRYVPERPTNEGPYRRPEPPKHLDVPERLRGAAERRYGRKPEWRDFEPQAGMPGMPSRGAGGNPGAPNKYYGPNDPRKQAVWNTVVTRRNRDALKGLTSEGGTSSLLKGMLRYMSGK